MTKSFRIPKWSVLLAPSLNYTILTRSCCVISVRWKLWSFCIQFSIVHSWQRNWKVHAICRLLQCVCYRINLLIIFFVVNTAELFSSWCILSEVMDQRYRNSEYKQCARVLWITMMLKLYVHAFLEVSLNRSYIFRRFCPTLKFKWDDCKMTSLNA